MGFWRIVITIILPPLGVLLSKGFGWAFIINILLTLLGYIPGLIHAFWVANPRLNLCSPPRR
nr:YqaE/Pmp3 family membrane protein [Escherichia coli]